MAAYCNVDLGFNNSIKGFSDELLYAAEFGYTFKGRLTAILRVRGIESRENGDDGVGGGMGGLYANNQSYLTYGPELIYDLSKSAGISASVGNAGYARNALEAPVFSLGFFIKQ